MTAGPARSAIVKLLRETAWKFAVSSQPTRSSGSYAADDATFGVPRGHSYVDPTRFTYVFETPDVVVDLSTAIPVVRTLIVGTYPDVFPAHVQGRHQHAVLVVHRDLGLRPGKPCPDE